MKLRESESLGSRGGSSVVPMIGPQIEMLVNYESATSILGEDILSNPMRELKCSKTLLNPTSIRMSSGITPRVLATGRERNESSCL